MTNLYFKRIITWRIFIYYYTTWFNSYYKVKVWHWKLFSLEWVKIISSNSSTNNEVKNNFSKNGSLKGMYCILFNKLFWLYSTELIENHRVPSDCNCETSRLLKSINNRGGFLPILIVMVVSGEVVMWVNGPGLRTWPLGNSAAQSIVRGLAKGEHRQAVTNHSPNCTPNHTINIEPSKLYRSSRPTTEE